MNIIDIELVEAVIVPTEKCYWEKWQCHKCDKIYPCEVTITTAFNDQQQSFFTRKVCLTETTEDDSGANWVLVGSSVHTDIEDSEK